jgi:hypothetical protein
MRWSSSPERTLRGVSRPHFNFFTFVGLDTADKHRLLDQRLIPEANCQVAGIYFQSKNTKKLLRFCLDFKRIRLSYCVGKRRKDTWRKGFFPPGIAIA